MRILAIESSCDETAAAIIEAKGQRLSVLANVVASQIAIHQRYGGVVPEVAAREHVLNVLPVIEDTLAAAGINRQQASKTLDAIAVTSGPGLITSLMVGAETARSLAYAWQLPLVPVNHIAGHIYAAWLSGEAPEFPAVIMTVSGGHNMLIGMSGPLKYKVIGDTRDDAAGEAFDKAAKILGLGYPGGPAIGAAARQASEHYQDIKLPRPMLHDGSLDFSFSGLKTALLYKVQKDANWQARLADYAAEFQDAVVDTLVGKTLAAAKKQRAKTVILSGGVSANQRLRQVLSEACARQLPQVKLIITPLEYTTDNAAMIGAAGAFLLQAGKTVDWRRLKADPGLELK